MLVGEADILWINTMEIAIRLLSPLDQPEALDVINAAAAWYEEFLPQSELHDPEMTPTGWDTEAQRLDWFGAFDDGRLIAVMGREYVRDVALLRHGYVAPDYQRLGVARALQEYIETQIEGVDRVLVGTYAANYKARALLEQTGYLLSPDSEALLRAYYDIPEDRLCASVTYEKTI